MQIPCDSAALSHVPGSGAACVAYCRACRRTSRQSSGAMSKSALQRLGNHETHRDVGKTERGSQSFGSGADLGRNSTAHLQNGVSRVDSVLPRQRSNQILALGTCRVDQGRTGEGRAAEKLKWQGKCFQTQRMTSFSWGTHFDYIKKLSSALYKYPRPHLPPERTANHTSRSRNLGRQE